MARQVRIFILLLLAILLLACFASAFEVTTSEEASIYPNETATYTFKVDNAGEEDEKLQLMLTFDPKWSFETEPLSYLSGFTVKKGESSSFVLQITPISEYISSGKYSILVPIKSDSGEGETVKLFLHLKNPNALTGYLPSLNFLLDAQERIDPRQPAKVRLDIINRNPLNITELEVLLTSNLYNETKITSIEPLGTATVIFEIPYSPQQPPVNDTLQLVIVVGEKIFTPIKKNIEIIAYADIAEKQYPTKSFFFKTTETTVYTNNGNAMFTKELKYPLSSFTQFFTSTIPKGEVIKEQGQLYYKTSLTLPVDVPVTVTYSINYRPLVWLFLFILAVVGCYYLFRSPLIIKKEAVTFHVDKDGRTKIKVLLHIKNRSMHLVDDIEILDKIPAVAEIEKHFEIGTVKPEKILKHDKGGTVLIWNIPHMEAYEERIITYKVNSMYQIIGDFELPATLLKFKNKKQQIVMVYSNTVKVGKKAEDR